MHEMDLKVALYLYLITESVYIYWHSCWIAKINFEKQYL